MSIGANILQLELGIDLLINAVTFCPLFIHVRNCSNQILLSQQHTRTTTINLHKAIINGFGCRYTRNDITKKQQMLCISQESLERMFQPFLDVLFLFTEVLALSSCFLYIQNGEDHFDKSSQTILIEFTCCHFFLVIITLKPLFLVDIHLQYMVTIW